MTADTDYQKRLDELYNQRDLRCKMPLEQADAASKHAIDFAQRVIQFSFLINGGAIVALPTFVKAFFDTTPIDVETLYWSIACYCIGLIATWGSAFCAYLSLVYVADSYRKIANKIDCDLRSERFPDDSHKSSWVEQSNKDKEEADKSEKSSEKCRFWAIGLSVASILLFIGGSIFGTKAIIHDASVSIIQETSLSTPEPLTEVTNPVKEEKAPPIVEEKKEPPKNEK